MRRHLTLPVTVLTVLACTLALGPAAHPDARSDDATRTAAERPAPLEGEHTASDDAAWGEALEHLDEHGHATVALADGSEVHADRIPADAPEDTETATLRRQAGFPARPTAARAESAGTYRPPGTPTVGGLNEHVLPSCAGTGTDGRRVQVLYVREVDQPSRLTQMREVFLHELGTIDDLFATSQAHAGTNRRVRWVHSNCVPVITEVVVADNTLDGRDYLRLHRTLATMGYSKPSRVYLAFHEEQINATFTCGMAQRWVDDSPVGNLNENSGFVAAVNPSCWSSPSQSTPAHELIHSLGAVSATSPNTTGHGHCTDGADPMCYRDSPYDSSAQRSVCAAPNSSLPLLDCNGDDYYNPAPVHGTWLASHWNTAHSPYLDVSPSLTGVGLTVAAPNQQPIFDEAVTFTATTDQDAAIRWVTTSPGCTHTVTDHTARRSSLRMLCPDDDGHHRARITAHATTDDARAETASVVTTFDYPQAPEITVKGPQDVQTRTPARFTAKHTGSGTRKLTWKITGSGCSISATTGDSADVTCVPASGPPTWTNATLRVTVTTSFGDKATDTVSLRVLNRKGFLAWPDAKTRRDGGIRGGRRVDFEAAPVARAKYKWTASHPRCNFQASGPDARLTCPVKLEGRVVVTVTATTGSTVHRHRTALGVTRASTGRTATRWTRAGVTRSRLTARLATRDNTPLAGMPVVVRTYTGGRWVRVGKPTTNVRGVVKFRSTKLRAGTRVQVRSARTPTHKPAKTVTIWRR